MSKIMHSRLKPVPYGLNQKYEGKKQPVAAQAEILYGNSIRRSNGSLHRVLACSAGGPGFDSRLRHNILRCSMQRM